jgi:hypothetical protein
MNVHAQRTEPILATVSVKTYTVEMLLSRLMASTLRFRSCPP